MIWVLISTSSPIVGVAIFRDDELLDFSSGEAPRRASGATIAALRSVLENTKTNLFLVDLFVADLGPGSFTGVKVGVTITKTLAYAEAKMAAGFSAFDLISRRSPVAIPSRKGFYLFREPGGAPIEIAESDSRLKEAVGYGVVFDEQIFPSAERAGELFDLLSPVSPMELVPQYVLEPSISQPKKPYGLPE